ncbi:FAD-binding oxidoreductase [Echinicola jeungdonensis]|uniref:FAD-binding oxidoreductase n=1 Tax=Echinicola jeungdonensis TaxID=709343 RepID=A0ABV5J759_9BACT|nr:FAD-binding oxidoreductase [Echinicola jeungdonensis]MDN3669179.1 FAD-binding oxidoreductase [Echinicola jeungdonensis]
MSPSTIHNTKVVKLNETLVQELEHIVRGMVITPDSLEYDESRKVYNGMIDRYPSLIVKCSNVADVIHCVQFAKSHQLTVAIKGGGHNAGGLGMVDNGLVIDLSNMKGILFNLAENTVRVEGGCTLGDLDHATQAFGQAVPTGILSTTGISGLTLGGGLGHLSRAYGLTIDSLLEADMVLADGSFVKVDQENHPDLFWAIRGGGGNFGIVTSFKFQMHPVGIIQGGPMFWPLSEAREIMKFYREFILGAPKEIYCYFAFLTVPPVPIFPEELHLKKMCGLLWCNIGDEARSQKALQKFRDFKKPVLDYVGPIHFDHLQTMFDALYPKGLQWYWKADFVKDLSDEAIEENLKHANNLPTPHSTVHFYPINGASHDKSNTDTAFCYRDANWAQVIVGVDPDPANKDKISQWAKAYWDGIHPYSAGGAYVNFMMEEGTDRVKASYRDNYEKLAHIKAKYDPDNFFSINQNIPPKPNAGT